MIHDEKEMGGVSNRLLNTLHLAGISEVEDFLRLSREDLLDIPGIGPKTADEVQRVQKRIEAARSIN